MTRLKMFCFTLTFLLLSCELHRTNDTRLYINQTSMPQEFVLSYRKITVTEKEILIADFCFRTNNLKYQRAF